MGVALFFDDARRFVQMQTLSGAIDPRGPGQEGWTICMMGKPREQGELFAMLVGNASLARTDALLVDTREAIESRFAREHRHAQVAEECALVSNLLALEAIQKMDLEKQEHVAFGGEILARLAAVRSARDAPFPIAPELLAVAGSEIRF